MVKLRNNNYLGIVLVVVILSFGLLRKYSAHDDIKKPKFGTIFSNSSDLISPPFTHSDNVKYRFSKTAIWYRSFFIAPGVAVADLNKDGFQDFVIINSTAGALPQVYINNHGKDFVDDSKKWIDKSVISAEIDPYESNISPFLFDFDGDDDLDMFVTSMKCSKFFLNNSDKFVYQPNHPLSKDCDGSISALPYDFDGDNKLDLMVIRYWNSEWPKLMQTDDQGLMLQYLSKVFKGGSNAVLSSRSGGLNSVYYNDLRKVVFDQDDSRWSFDAVVTDLNNDGKNEIVVANDFGDDRIFNFDAKGFYDVSRDFLYPDRRNGMNVAVNYLPNDPYPFLFISNLWVKDFVEKGNFYWHKSKWRSQLSDEAEKNNLDSCGTAWSSAFGDFNIDGFNDVYVANGYMTIPESDDRKGNFMMMAAASLPTVESFNKIPSAAQKYFIISVGKQVDCLKIYSPKDEKFTDYQIDKSIDAVPDTRAAAMIDFDNDGDLDLLVTAQNDNLQLLKNNTQEKTPHKNWVGFNIKNQEFLRKITLQQGEDKYYKDWQGGRTGFLTTSDRRVYFTMKNEKDVEVTFKFIDGHEVTKKFSPGKYYDLGKI